VTAEEKAQIAGAFRAAKRRLWDGRLDGRGDAYICLALASAKYSGEISGHAARWAEEVVMSRISPDNTVANWLRHNAGVDPEVAVIPPRDLQAYKHRWLDALIEEFSTKDET
jgi:hypothetical protein